MSNSSPEPGKTPAYKSKQRREITSSISSLCSPKLLIYLAAIFILFQTLRSTSFDFANHRQKTLSQDNNSCSNELKSMAFKLQESVTFLPLKDLRYSSKALQGHTQWRTQGGSRVVGRPPFPVRRYPFFVR
ncbi:hypothetical protein CASFOL_035880 [Castilleja foliolosa]|uniref:Transmembrane protein n=1 Tax=Castilleja foliolosa TaxID=1961234 RepID=A0ABD3BTZ3_9LAMI